jgi:CheY-like chemotaxis protein
MSHLTILCVDDYETSLAGWCLYLPNAGYSVTTARTAHDGLERFAVSPVDLVLLDYKKRSQEVNLPRGLEQD